MYIYIHIYIYVYPMFDILYWMYSKYSILFLLCDICNIKTYMLHCILYVMYDSFIYYCVYSTLYMMYYISAQVPPPATPEMVLRGSGELPSPLVLLKEGPWRGKDMGARRP